MKQCLDSMRSSITSSIRFLISNAAAGLVIGKGGATISDFQAQSGARIQLSRNHACFPGTTDRIIMICGTVVEISTALYLILSKIMFEAEDENDGDHKPNHVRLIVPNNVCGAIIGKGGSTIKGFVEETGANIKLSPQDQTTSGVNNRLVTITGTLEQQLRAVDSIITKLSEDPIYAQYANFPISYSSLGLLGLQVRGQFIGPPIQTAGSNTMAYPASNPGHPRSKGYMPALVPIRSPVQITLPVLGTGPVTTSITLAVPDDRIGAIVGRGGKTITEIQQASGVKVKISDRGDFVAGTKNRDTQNKNSRMWKVFQFLNHISGLLDKKARCELLPGSPIREIVHSRLISMGEFCEFWAPNWNLRSGASCTESCRKVTIAGTTDGVHIAQHLLTRKVQQSIEADYER